MNYYLVVKKPGENAVLVDSSRGFELVKETVGYVTLIGLGEVLLAVNEDALLQHTVPNISHPQVGLLYDTLVATIDGDPNFEGMDEDLALRVSNIVDSLSV